MGITKSYVPPNTSQTNQSPNILSAAPLRPTTSDQIKCKNIPRFAKDISLGAYKCESRMQSQNCPHKRNNKSLEVLMLELLNIYQRLIPGVLLLTFLNLYVVYKFLYYYINGTWLSQSLCVLLFLIITAFTLCGLVEFFYAIAQEDLISALDKFNCEKGTQIGIYVRILKSHRHYEPWFRMYSDHKCCLEFAMGSKVKRMVDKSYAYHYRDQAYPYDTNWYWVKRFCIMLYDPIFSLKS